jgi:hypothetical protein
VLTLNASDISPYCDNTEPEKNADEHDVTTYGKTNHVIKGGLKGGKCTISGVYEAKATATSPKAVIEPLIGTNVTFILKPEGTGTGKPQDSVDVLVKSYKETLPVADYIRWNAELTYSDTVTSTTQA